MLKVAHILGTTPQDQLRAAMARARENGFDGVEMVIGDGRTCELSISAEACAGVADAAKDGGTPIRALCLADDPRARIGSSVETERLDGLARVRAALERCEWLGAGTLRLTAGAVGPREDGRMDHYQDALNHTYRSLRSLRGDSERAGVVGAVEVCRHKFLLSPPEMRELIDRVNTPWLGAALDWTACEPHGAPLDWADTLQHRISAVVADEASAERTLPLLEHLNSYGPVIITPRT